MILLSCVLRILSSYTVCKSTILLTTESSLSTGSFCRTLVWNTSHIGWLYGWANISR